MIRTVVMITSVLYTLFAGFVLKECVFLSPLRKLIWHSYSRPILWFSSLLLLNVGATVYVLVRRLALKDTGDKLAHLEKQLRGHGTISKELTERILDPR
jgi:hypothetical protein